MKGVIVAAGYGTRFLPVTKTLPKEMLPLYDRPLIDFILDEFEEAGIKDVIIISSRRKKVLEDYLDRETELEHVLEKGNKKDSLRSIRPRNMNFCFIRQQEMKGTGQALLLIKPYIKDEPFIVAYPDDIVIGSPGVSSMMIDMHKTGGKNILAVRKELINPSRYGVVRLKKTGRLDIEELVEKPAKKDAPSDLISIGRYLFTPEILSILEKGYEKHHEGQGEYYHIDAINKLASEDKVSAFEISGLMLDTGEPESYLMSLLMYIERHPSGSLVLKEFLSKFKA
ncbi:MAG: UTP--glucose-1-phosphate uridylyltransferase [Brevinematales bacterium]|jgi:UTP--glucose-1-phosphate uridylyltransferase